MSTSADTARRNRLLGTRAEGVALLVVTATIWRCTWPQNKYLLSLLAPFTARGIPNLLGAAFALAVAVAPVLGDPLGPRQVIALVLTLTGVAMAAIRWFFDGTPQEPHAACPS